MQAPAFLRSSIERLEHDDRLDRLADGLTTVATPLSAGRRGEILRADWLGHALHPLLTDIPMGCWLAAGLLDVVGGKTGRRPATRLVGAGLVAAVPTIAAGLAELGGIPDEPRRRVTAVHAAGNTVVAASYFASWRARHKGHHLRGVVYGMLGGGIAWITGYLGGHLSFARSTGTGPRGLDEAHDAEPVQPVGAPVPGLPGIPV
jgi:uncharacterized membrane protein